MNSQLLSLNIEDSLVELIEQVFLIQDTTWGDDKQGYFVRYRGSLRLDSMLAYDKLTVTLKQYNLMPLFRVEGDSQIIILVKRKSESKPSNPLINLILFIVTVLSVIFAGTLYSYQGPEFNNNFIALMKYILFHLDTGLSFAVSLMAILLAHEFGHYFVGRKNNADVSLPYYIPFPFSPFGTMGAFINMKSPPKNRRALLEIGIAGPLAGLAVAIPVLLIGLSLSSVHPLPGTLEPGRALSLEGNSLLYLLLKYIAFGKLLPEPSTFGNIPPLLYWIRYYFLGIPLPIGGIDVNLNGIAWAGWAGLLVTSLNLIPAGQLDGGHILYVLLGNNTRKVYPIIVSLLVMMGFVWSGWWLWAFLLFLLGRTYAEPLDQITQLDTSHKLLAVFGLVIFIFVFIPVPLIVIGG
ncbi:MAG: site-2 protease family protein [Chloroflexota bacterium]